MNILKIKNKVTSINGVHDRKSLMFYLRTRMALIGVKSQDLMASIDKSRSYLTSTIEVSSNWRIKQLLTMVAPKLKLSAKDLHTLLLGVKGTHGRDFVNPKDRAGRELLYFYVKAFALANNTSLRAMSQDYGKNGGYLFKLIRHTNRFSISRVTDAIPSLDYQEVEQLLDCNHAPFHRLLAKIRSKVHDRKSLVKYLQCVACEHETTLSLICKRANHNKSYLYLAVNNNLKPSVEYAIRLMANVLSINPKPLLNAVEHAHIKSRTSPGKYSHSPKVSLNHRLHQEVPKVIKGISYKYGHTLRDLSRQMYNNGNQIWEIMNGRSLFVNYKLLIKIQKYTGVHTKQASRLNYLMKLYFS